MEEGIVNKISFFTTPHIYPSTPAPLLPSLGVFVRGVSLRIRPKDYLVFTEDLRQQRRDKHHACITQTDWRLFDPSVFYLYNWNKSSSPSANMVYNIIHPYSILLDILYQILQNITLMNNTFSPVIHSPEAHVLKFKTILFF